MTDREFLDIISGRDQSGRAGCWRGLFALAAIPYGLAASAKNRMFDWGLRSPARVDLPVISVGNLTTGGTGKTPVVAWVVQQLQQLGRRPAIVSRGYRALTEGENDEKRLLDQLCPGVPHIQNGDRVQAARQLLADSAVDAIVLDDAFQHRRLARNLDLVLIDATNPWGYDALLPRGLLRESKAGLARAGVVLITRADLVSSESLSNLRREIIRWTEAPVLDTAFVPSGLVNSRGDRFATADQQQKIVAAVCGIGNPGGFQQTLAGCGIKIPEARQLIYPDHHHYSASDLQEITLFAQRCQADLLVTTRKDLVKLNVDRVGGVPLAALEIELNFRESAAPLQQVLQDLVWREGI